MAIYKVQGPDGAIHRFEGPDDASEDDVLAAAEAQFGSSKTDEGSPLTSAVEGAMFGDAAPKGSGRKAVIAGSNALSGFLGAIPDLATLPIRAMTAIPQDTTGPLKRSAAFKGTGRDALLNILGTGPDSTSLPPSDTDELEKRRLNLMAISKGAYTPTMEQYKSDLSRPNPPTATEAIASGLGKLTDITPETKGEKALASGAQIFGGGFAPLGQGAITPQMFMSNTLAGTGGGIAAMTDNPYDDFLLPLLGGSAPLLYQKAKGMGKRQIGKLLDFSPESIKAQEDAGLRVTAQGASRSESKQNFMNRMASTFGGRELRKAGEDASDIAQQRLLGAGYDPNIQRGDIGRSVVEGTKRYVGRELGQGARLKEGVTEALKGQRILVPNLNELKREIAFSNLDESLVDKAQDFLESNSFMDYGTNQKFIDIDVLNNLKTMIGRGTNAKEAATANAIYAKLKGMEESAAAASPKMVGNKNVLEATEAYNKQYREGISAKKGLVDRITKDPIQQGDELVYAAKPLEESFRAVHTDVKSNPSRFTEYSDMLTAPRKEKLFKANMKEFAGGKEADLQKWAKSINDLEDDSLKALTYNDAALADDLKVLAKGIDLNKNTAAFGSKAETAPITENNPFNWVMNAMQGTGRIITNGVIGKMLADPEAIKIMAGMKKAIIGKQPIGAYSQSLNKLLDKYDDSETDTIEGGEGRDEVKGSGEKIIWEKTLPRSADAPKVFRGGVPKDIQREEGLRLKSYKDTRGYTTVGYGFNMDNPAARKVWQEAGIKAPFQAVKRGRQALTKDEADKLAKHSYSIAFNDAKRIYPNFNKLSENRRQALVNLSYQLGGSRLREFEKANRAIRNGKFDIAAKHLAQSAWAKQTPERAQRIIAMLKEDKPYKKQG